LGPRLLCLQELIRNLGSQDGSPLLQIGSVQTVNEDSVEQRLAKHWTALAAQNEGLTSRYLER
jgi:hypothetical protein